jgi:hypothetical protein
LHLLLVALEALDRYLLDVSHRGGGARSRRVRDRIGWNWRSRMVCVCDRDGKLQDIAGLRW